MIAVNALLALLVLVAVVCRLAMMAPCSKALRARAAWHAWVGAHVLIGVGAFGFLYAGLAGVEPQISISALYSGLAMLLLVRWQRRQGDR